MLPCKDRFIMLTAHANYQVGVWRRCLEWEPDIPYPIDHGLIMGAPGIRSVDWMSRAVHSKDVQELLSCKCTRQCTFPDCMCMKNELKCKCVCKIQTRVNMTAVDVISEW